MARKKIVREVENLPDGKVKKPFYKKWWFWLIVVVTIGPSFISGDEDSKNSDIEIVTEESSSSVSSGKTKEEIAAEEQKKAEEEAIAAEQEAKAKAESIAKAEEEAAAKAEEEAKAIAEAESILAELTKPIDLSGSGDTVTESIQLEKGFVVMTATHDGGRNFAVKMYGPNDQDLLINTIGSYEGEKFFLTDSGEYKFEVTADGNWNFNFQRKVPEEVEGTSISGYGDEVRFVQLSPASYTVSATHSGDRNFVVKANGQNLLFNEIGIYSGQKIQKVNDEAVYAIEISADGEWTLDFTE